MTIFKRAMTALTVSVVLFAAGSLLQEALKMYRDGTLSAHPEALRALQAEAERGNTDAAFLLATSYREGKAGRKDLTKALRWYRAAAKRGDADAMLMLGWLHYKGGPNLPPDEAAAKRWFEKAAARGVDEAVEMLEIMQEG